MGSEESWNRTETHKLCANGCGFFGTASTLNLCSKCYRDFRIREEQETKAKAAVEKSFNPTSPSLTSSLAKTLYQEQAQEPISLSVVGASSSSEAAGKSSSEVPQQQQLKNRCFCCKKRVGLTGFQCRCGSTFCGTHRYPESHSCTFDFKEIARDAIAKANPVVKADKVDRI